MIKALFHFFDSAKPALASLAFLFNHFPWEIQTRCDERSLFDESFNTFVIHHVAVIDHVDSSLEGSENSFLRDNMAADLLTAFVCCFCGGVHFGLTHSHHIRRPHEAVSAGGIQ